MSTPHDPAAASHFTAAINDLWQERLIYLMLLIGGVLVLVTLILTKGYTQETALAVKVLIIMNAFFAVMASIFTATISYLRDHHLPPDDLGR